MSSKFEYKPEFLYLNTIGRKSGEPREIEIWFVPYNDCYYLCSEHPDKANWVQNIQNNPQVSFWVEGQTYQGTGRAVDREAEPELAQTITELLDAKYQWSTGLIVQLRPNT